MFRLDGVAAGGNLADAVSMGKDLEVGDWIANAVKEWVDGDSGAVFHPNVPMVILFSGVRRIDSGAHRLLDKAKVSAECISGHT